MLLYEDCLFLESRREDLLLLGLSSRALELDDAEDLADEAVEDRRNRGANLDLRSPIVPARLGELQPSGKV